MAEIDLRQINLDKGDLIMGLGGNRALFISRDGDVSEVGERELPSYAYLMFPLIARVIPEEYEGPGGFTDIMKLEEKLGKIFGSAEDVYDQVGPALARKGVSAQRLADAFIQMSPIQTSRNTNDLNKDAYHGYSLRLAEIIKGYYPGSSQINKKIRNPRRIISLDTGKHKSKDGVSF